jgi:catechol 2,3-dioxygenase-like lactoylglutathione lyase family enzyme
MITGFRHAGISVADMEASLSFYRGVLGLALVSDRVSPQGGRLAGVEGEIRICVLEVPGSGPCVELVEYHDVETKQMVGRACDLGAGHASFRVDSADELYRLLRARGMEIACEPITTAVGTKIFYAKDPDGFWLEFTEMPL